MDLTNSTKSTKEEVIHPMQGDTYLIAAYAIAWIGLFAYLAFLMMRVRGVQTELAAVTELVREQREQREQGKAQNNGHASWEADKQAETYTNMAGED
jgi:CcmD family protein